MFHLGNLLEGNTVRSTTAIVLAIFIVLSAEAIAHWYAGRAATPSADSMAAAYLYRDPDNHKAFVAGLVDLVAPAVILGVAIGWFGVGWSPRRLTATVAVVSLALVAMIPAYSRCFENRGAHWWSPTDSVPLTPGDYVPAYMKAAALCGVSTYGARLARSTGKRAPRDRH